MPIKKGRELLLYLSKFLPENKSQSAVWSVIWEVSPYVMYTQNPKVQHPHKLQVKRTDIKHKNAAKNNPFHLIMCLSSEFWYDF
jgi:hypothetical protein